MRAGAVHRVCYSHFIIQMFQIAHTDALLSAQLEAKEVLIRTSQALAPSLCGHASQRLSVNVNGPGSRFIKFCKKLDQCGFPRSVFANDRDDRTRGQPEFDVPEH